MPGHKSKIIEVKGGFRYRDFIVGIVVAFAIVIAFEHFRSAHIFSSIPIKIFPATVEIMMEPKAATDEFAIPSRELARDVASESSIFGSSLYAQFRNAFMTRKPNDGKLKNINNYEYNAAQEFTHSSAETTSSMKTSLLGQSINKLLQLMPTSKESSLNDTNGDSAASTVRSLTKPYCKAKYGTKRFLKASEKRKPPMLYTFPGSGNTWCRLLIEHGTSVFSGSVYNDQSLLAALPGEFTCDWTVSVVKVHPHTHDFAHLNGGGFNSDNNKCKKGNVKKFDRAILLIRNPYDSIWSEFQRRVTQSHVEGILKSTFNWPRWQANAANLAHQYHRMWNTHYMGIERSYSASDILYIRYEDLKDKGKRVGVLREVVRFLRIDVTEEQLACSFVLSNNDKAHRSIDEDIEMTKNVAYTEPLACRMWGLFGKYAAAHGYHPWRNFTCDKPEALPHVNVGPRGEYGHDWVRPGQSLLDFGGHDESSSGKGYRPKQLSGKKGFFVNQQAHFTATDSHSSDGAMRSAEQPQSQVALPKGTKLTPDGRIVLAGAKTNKPNPVLFQQAAAKLETGMTLDDAMTVSGIGRLGETQPVWS